MSRSSVTLGGPLFRRTDSTHDEFSASWHRHARLVAPWFLHFGVTEYTQIHLSSAPSTSVTLLTMSPTFGHIPPETLTQAERILRRADGIAIVTCRPIKTQSGDTRPFGDGSLHPYFKQVIAIDERRFLHAESGATAVIVQKPDFDVPELDAATWWGLAAQLGDVHTEEVVVVKDGKLLLESEADQWNSLWSQLHTRFEMK